MERALSMVGSIEDADERAQSELEILVRARMMSCIALRKN
jgi:hypothetical protein